MKAILLAAGLGTRLKPVTDLVPKCLVPIRQKPLLAYWMENLLENGIDEVLINTHHLADLVEDFIFLSPWKNQVKLVHEKTLLGTAGTVLKNRDFIGNETFFLAHADNLTRFDLQRFIQAHAMRKNGVEITMMTFDADTPQSCGIVELNDKGLVVGFHEKVKNPPGTRANAAVYLLEPSVFRFLESLGKEQIDFSTEVLPHYLGRMGTYHNQNYHRDIGTPESLNLAEMEF